MWPEEKKGGYGVLCLFQQYFSYIMAGILLIG